MSIVDNLNPDVVSARRIPRGTLERISREVDSSIKYNLFEPEYFTKDKAKGDKGKGEVP